MRLTISKTVLDTTANEIELDYFWKQPEWSIISGFGNNFSRISLTVVATGYEPDETLC